MCLYHFEEQSLMYSSGGSFYNHNNHNIEQLQECCCCCSKSSSSSSSSSCCCCNPLLYQRWIQTSCISLPDENKSCTKALIPPNLTRSPTQKPRLTLNVQLFPQAFFNRPLLFFEIITLQAYQGPTKCLCDQERLQLCRMLSLEVLKPSTLSCFF